MSVTMTILEQLGANRFRAMTGAKNFLALEAGVQFDLPRGFARDGITRVTIRLTPSDTYLVTFGKWDARNLVVRTIKEVPEVYAEDLRRIFTDATGLDCSLGKVA